MNAQFRASSTDVTTALTGLPTSAPGYRACVHLEAERLLMPSLTARHATALAEVYADPAVARYIGGAALDAEGAATQVRRFEAVWQEHGFGQSALLDRATGDFLGRAGLHPWPRWGEVELGYVLARHAQGRGLATEAASAWLDVAFGTLGLDRLTAVVHPDNAPSRTLATRLGFRVHREDVTPAGVPVLVHERLDQLSGRTSRPIARWASGA
jgi:RimJ/RimL family protein N-acetyltransferase